MLLEFRVANHRSLRDEQVLSMEAGRVGDASDPRPRLVKGHKEPLLTVAALYGANASGKSNVLAAVLAMCDAVLTSHYSRPGGRPVAREPFAWGSKQSESCLFEAVLLIDGVRYQYGFVSSTHCYQEEWLFAWPKGKKQVWYTRDENRFDFGPELKGEKRFIESATPAYSLFLSVASQHDHPQLNPVTDWFARVAGIHLDQFFNPFHARSEYNAHLLVDELDAYTNPPHGEADRSGLVGFKQVLIPLLQTADIDIADLRVQHDAHSRSRGIEVKHLASCGEEWLNLQQESQGTRTLLWMAKPMLAALQAGSVLLVDELERSLHPNLCQQIVRQFNDPTTNPHNAQLIFTTHDTNLLGSTTGEPVLRRDQVWLTEKDREGATVLYPLTDYKPRKEENLERGYLQGRYGAIPFLGELSFAGK